MKKEFIFYIMLILIIFLSLTVSAENIDLGTYTTEKVDSPSVPNINPPEIEGGERMYATYSNSNFNQQRLSDSFIISSLGENYFNEHFEFGGIEERDFLTFFNYNFTYGKYETKLFVAILDGEINEPLSHILKKPQEINFDSKDASQKANSLGLGEPRRISLVYSDKQESLVWRIDWEREPSIEEMINEETSGYLFSVDDGEILETIRFVIDPKDDEETQNFSQNYLILIVLGVFSILILLIILIKKQTRK